MVSAVSGVPAPSVVLTAFTLDVPGVLAVARVSAVAAVSTAAC